MALFEVLVLFVLILITLILISGIILAIFFIDAFIKTLTCAIAQRQRNKKAFDKAHPVGFTFSTKLKQRFPYGKWKLLGKDQNDCFIYERLK